MRRPAALPEDHALRLGLGLLGILLTASAALAAGLARDHMALLGVICGARPVPHCGWCYGAAGLGLPGLAAFAAAVRMPRSVENRWRLNETGFIEPPAPWRSPRPKLETS